MKKASKKTAKKAAKKKPVSFDDVVDSAPGQVLPVSQAKDPINPYTGEVSVMTIMENIQAGHDEFPEGMGETIEPIPVFHQLGTEPRDEEEEWDPVESTEHTWGLEATQEHSFGLAAPSSKPEPETQPQAPSDEKKVHMAGLPPFNPDEVDLPVVSPTLEETIEVFSSLMQAFQWLYRRTKKKVRLLPEDDGKLHQRWGKAEAHMNKLKKLQ